MLQLFKNNVPVACKIWTFPGKEIGVKVEDIDPFGHYVIEAQLPDSDELFAILNIADALSRAGVEKHHVHLHLSYLPYSRQDRVCHPGESFALDVFLRVLATAPIGLISTLDAHSKVSETLMEKYFDSSMNIPQSVCACDLPIFDALIAPDLGAHEKIVGHPQVETSRVPVFLLNKIRKDGQVVYEDYPSDVISGNVCVVDDLADGSATFVALGEMLRRTQPRITCLSLYVTHGLFSKGVDIVKAVYDNVYVNNMMNEADTEKVILI